MTQESTRLSQQPRCHLPWLWLWGLGEQSYIQPYLWNQFLFLFLSAGGQWSQLVFSVQAVASPARQRSLRDPWTAGWRKPWTSCGQKAIPSLASRSLLHSLHKIEYIIVLAKSTFHFVLMMYNYLQSSSLCLFAEREQPKRRKSERARRRGRAVDGASRCGKHDVKVLNIFLLLLYIIIAASLSSLKASYPSSS